MLSSRKEIRIGGRHYHRAIERRLVPHPFLHVDEGCIYNPATGRSLRPGDDGYLPLRSVIARKRGTDRRHLPLAADGWLVDEGRDVSTTFRLRFVSIEAHSRCNQACFFCPVAEAPRPGHTMPDGLFSRIVGELAEYGGSIEGVFLNNYNEPTMDRRFVDQVVEIKSAGLPPAVLTNGSGLTPRRADALVDLGGLRYLSVNLTTLDPDDYRRERGVHHLTAVLRNVDYAARRPLAPQMEIVVLGMGDEAHARAFQDISARYAGTHFQVKRHEIMDRAGYFSFGRRPESPHRGLCGCENMGSRPVEHLTVTATGSCVICCEDYDERWAVGNLAEESVASVLGGPSMARMRRWAYGMEEAPEDFICRRCVFARTPS